MDIEHKCSRCGEAFKRKDTLITHLKRKNECKPIVSNVTRASIIDELTKKQYNDKTYDCEFCKKKFNQPSSKSRHKDICKKNPVNMKTEDTIQENVEVEDTDAGPSTSYVMIDKHDYENMKRQVAQLAEEVRSLKGNSASVSNNFGSIQNININLNSFGQENVSHLTDDFLSHCLMNPTKGLPSLIETIHYNKDVPENHNIRCKSLKQNIFEKYVDSEWRSCDASNTLDELIRRGYKILNTHYAKHFQSDPNFADDEQRQRAIERFRFLSDKTCNEYFAVKREVRILVKDRTVYLIAPPDDDEVVTNADEVAI